MKLVVTPIKDSPYFDVVDVAPALCPGTRVIRASYCTKRDAELFADAPRMAARIAFLEGLWVVRVWIRLARWLRLEETPT